MISDKAKKLSLALAVRNLKRKGFSSRSARLWSRERARDLKNRPFSQWGKTIQQHNQGFATPAADLLVTETIPALLNQRDYYLLQPINQKRVWLKNRVAASKGIPALSEFLPTQFCTMYTFDTGTDIVRLQQFPQELEASLEGIFGLLEREGSLRVIPVKWNRGVGRVFSIDDDGYRIDGWPATEEDVTNMITQMTSQGRCVFTSHDESTEQFGERFGLRNAVLRLFVAKDDSGQAQIVDAEINGNDDWRPQTLTDEEILQAKAEFGIKRGWGKRRQVPYLGEERYETTLPIDLESDSIVGEEPVVLGELRDVRERIEEIFSAEQATFTFIAVDLGLTSDGDFIIQDVLSYVRFPSRRIFSAEAQMFLEELLQAKLERIEQNRKTLPEQVKGKVERYQTKYAAFHLRAQGFTGRMARAWASIERQAPKTRITEETRVRDVPQHWGFTPATVRRFGITRRNVDNFVSEREYSFVHPLNGKYAKWVRDRVSAHTVFAPYTDLFETMHYQLLRRGNDLQIIPLSERAIELGDTVEGIGTLLQETGGLTLTSSAWVGRTELSVTYDGNVFHVGEIAYSIDEFTKLLTRRVRRQFYVLVEPAGKDIHLSGYSSSGDTELRVLMINPDGAHPAPVEAALVIHEREDTLTDEVFEKLKTTAKQALRGARGALGENLEAEIERSEHRAETAEEGLNQDYNRDEIDIELEEEIDTHLQRGFQLVAQVDPDSGEFNGANLPVGNRLITMEKHPTTETSFNGSIPAWQSIRATLEELCRFAPQLDFVQFTVRVTEDGIKIVGISALPPYNQNFPYSPKTVEFLKNKAITKRERTSGLVVSAKKWLRNAKLKIRRIFAQKLYPAGLVPYQSVRWIGDMRRDLMERNGIPLKTKIWAYKNGFLSYRIPQYGITPENREQFISDFEYRWLRHINKKYKYWLEDKISIKYVAAQHNECLPAYYYYTTTSGGTSHVVPMMDCPEGYEATYEDIIRLVQEKGVLALKPDEGSHGEGFYRLGYENGEYTLNGEPASETHVLEILKNPDNEYLITEFIQMHPELAKIYPFSVNTIRMIVFKKDGVTPTIGNAYLRIGSLKSGYVDNTAAGGMLAEINPETGEYGNAQVLENGRVSPCPVHPDTGVLIEGQIPNWEYAKAKVLEMALDLPQLEYLGFDLAITEDGFKLPEINRFPDYPRIDKLTPETIDYLLYKVAEKKRVYGYDRKPPKTLFNLPPRDAS